MNVVNPMMDRAMRRLVALRMRPHIRYSAATTAVTLVAPQHDMLGGAVSNVARLVEMARAAHLTVIYAPMAPPAANWGAQVPSQRAMTDAGLLRPGSPGADIHPALTPADADHVLQPFPGVSAFTNAALAGTLTSAQLDHVIIAGARTDIEVDSTARDATEAGLHTTVISDCCTGSSPEAHEKTARTTLPRLVHAVLTLADLAAVLR